VLASQFPLDVLRQAAGKIEELEKKLTEAQDRIDGDKIVVRLLAEERNEAQQLLEVHKLASGGSLDE
jgi:hypothetical protein